MFEDDNPVVILEVLNIRANDADNTCPFQADPVFCCIHEAHAYEDILTIRQDTVNSYGYRKRLTLKFSQLHKAQPGSHRLQAQQHLPEPIAEFVSSRFCLSPGYAEAPYLQQ